MTNEIIAAVAGGFLGWVIIQLATYLTLRSRLTRYLEVQINRKLWALKVNGDWLEEIGETNVCDGLIIRGAAKYSRDDMAELKETRDLALRYLTRTEIEKLTKLTATLWESECLCDGFCEALRLYAEKNVPLSDDDCRYLKAKIKRLSSLIHVLPERIGSLNELPSDYAGVLGPTAVVIPPGKTGNAAR